MAAPVLRSEDEVIGHLPHAEAGAKAEEAGEHGAGVEGDAE